MNKYSKYRMYQESVQCVEADIDFVEEVYERLTGNKPVTLREDFCGTAAACCEWVRRAPGRCAWGVDLDAEVLVWGRTHNVSGLKPAAQQRVRLLCDDVRHVRAPTVDVILAMNFSYFLFKTRAMLRDYFVSVRRSLERTGIFVLDAFGGSESQRVLKETRECDGFTYVWEQARFDPVSHNMLCYIHFECDNGSRLSPAFTYDWRLWSLPEIRELLQEAGFTEVTVYWEGVDEESGEGNGVYTPCTQGTPDPAWIAYIVASA